MATNSSIKKDLFKLPRRELEDLLERQDKQLTRTKFINSLPDKGAKLRDFQQRIQKALDTVIKKDESKCEEAEISSLIQEFEWKAHLSLDGQSQETSTGKINRLLLTREKSKTIPVKELENCLAVSPKASPSSLSSTSSTSSNKVEILSLEESVKLQAEIGDGIHKRFDLPPFAILSSKQETTIKKAMRDQPLPIKSTDISSITKKPISKFIPYREPASDDSEDDDYDDRITEESESEIDV